MEEVDEFFDFVVGWRCGEGGAEEGEEFVFGEVGVGGKVVDFEADCASEQSECLKDEKNE